MTTVIKEGDIEFRFGDSWTVLKYDESPEYKNGIEKLSGVWKVDKDGKKHSRGCKGVDILCSRAGTLTFIEVKDFRKATGDRESRIQDELPFEIGFKACDTVAGVVGGARNVPATAVQGFAQMLIDASFPVEVILWMEEPPVTSEPAELLRRKSRLSTATSRLKQCCKWLTDRVLVVNSKEYARVLVDLKVST